MGKRKVLNNEQALPVTMGEKLPPSLRPEKRSYYEKLRDPRWQEKRLRVMDRDEFRCRECSSKDTTLNVHHAYYAKGREPWEYEDESLVTLCESCHEKYEASRQELLAHWAKLNLADQKILRLVVRQWSDFSPVVKSVCALGRQAYLDGQFSASLEQEGE